MTRSPIDENRVHGLVSKSDADDSVVVNESDPTTKRLKTNTTVTGDVNVTATDLDIRNLAFATDKVDASGTILGAGDNNIGNVDIVTRPADVTSSGTITTNGATLNPTLIQGGSDLGFQITGTWSGQIEFEVTVDGATWVSTRARSEASDDAVNATTTNGVFIVPVAGAQGFRLRASSWTSGTASAFFRASVGVHTLNIASPIPAGNNNIGDVDVASSALPTGAATSAKQDTGNTSLASIDTKLSSSATESTLSTLNGKVPDVSGTWGYSAGTNGTVTLTGSKRVLQITATALEAAGTITINGGDTITLPYGGTDKVSTSLTITPIGNLTDPSIVFSAGIDSYFVEHVT